MKRSIKIISFCCLLFATTACSKDNLILLDNKPMFVGNGEPRVIAKPDDIIVTGEVNRIAKVQWPLISSNIESATIIVMNNPATVPIKEFTVTNFEEDYIIDFDELGDYSLEIVYNSKNGSKSKARTMNITPQDYDVILMESDITLTPLSGRVRLDFNKRIMGDYEYTINYLYDGMPYSKTFLTTTDSLDSYIINDIVDDSYQYDFNIQIKDRVLDVSSALLTMSTSPLPLPAVLVDRSLTARTWLDGVLVSWSNNSGESVKVTASYMLDGVRKERSKISMSITDTIGFSSLPIGSYNIDVKIEDDYDSDRARLFNSIPVVPVSSFVSATAKQGWVAAVSSNQGNDGGGAPALIDGLPGTFWHTPYGGNAPSFPHSATITLPTKHKLTKLYLTIRNHQSANPWKDFELQTSVDGVTFRTHQVFQNLVNTPGAVLSHVIDNPVTTKYVRILFTSSLPSVLPVGGGPQTFMQLAEISFDGYKE